MGLLDSLNDKFNFDQNTVTVSVRMSPKENAILQEIADEIGCTRQDVIHQLISDYAIPEWNNLKNQPSNIDSYSNNDGRSFFLLNTNKTNSVIDHNLIIKENIAAAFEDNYIGKINKIKKDDIVFLYESGTGIIAYGTATGEIIDEPEPYKINHKSMRYQKLNDFKLLTKPLTAKDARQILGKGIPLIQTLSRISNGDLIYDKIKN